MFADGILEIGDGLLTLVFGQVPFVHHNHQRLLVFLNQLEDVHILRLNAAGGVEHQDAHVAVLDGADAAHHRIEFQVLAYLVLATDSGRVDQVEIESELVETGIDRVTRSAGNIGHDMTVFTDESVDY